MIHPVLAYLYIFSTTLIQYNYFISLTTPLNSNNHLSEISSIFQKQRKFYSTEIEFIPPKSS